jgi:hypothetical protein
MSIKIEVPAEFMEQCASIVETHIELMFREAHQTVNSKTGNINPAQAVYFDYLQDQLTKLMYQQVKQNISGEDMQINSGIDFIETFEQYQNR